MCTQTLYDTRSNLRNLLVALQGQFWQLLCTHLNSSAGPSSISFFHLRAASRPHKATHICLQPLAPFCVCCCCIFRRSENSSVHYSRDIFAVITVAFFAPACLTFPSVRLVACGTEGSRTGCLVGKQVEHVAYSTLPMCCPKQGDVRMCNLFRLEETPCLHVGLEIYEKSNILFCFHSMANLNVWG